MERTVPYTPSRQYIGARYVPIFADPILHDSTKTYEPLTIVLDGSGNSYTSKTFVPAGIALTNTTYWVKTGDYNAQVESYRHEVSELSEDIGILSQLHTDDKTSIVNAINNVVDEVIPEELNNRKLGTALYVGNSYLGGIGSTSGHDGIKKLTEHLFYDSYYKASSGAGFMTFIDHPITFGDLVEEFCEEKSEEVKNSITHVIFLSALGDSRWCYENTVSDAYPNFNSFHTELNAVSEYIKANLPNARMYVMLCDIVKNDNIINNTLRGAYWCHQMFKTGAARCGFTYLGYGGWQATHRAGYNDTDNYHPNDYGYKNLSNYLINSLLGSEYYTLRYNTFELRDGDNNTIADVTFKGTPDMIEVLLAPRTAITLDSSGQLVLCDMDTITGIYPYINGEDITIVVRDNSTGFYFGRLIFSGNTIKLTASANITLNQYRIFPNTNIINGFLKQ